MDGMSHSALADPPAPGGGTRSLVHRQRSWEPFGLSDATADQRQEFVLTGELTTGHPLVAAGPHRFHDLQTAVEMVRETGEFIGQTHFSVPANRTAVFYRVAVATRDVSAWRASADARGRPALLTSELRVRPDKVIDGVPRSLRFSTVLSIDDVPCGSGSADVVFLPPVVHRNHRVLSLATALTAPADESGADRPADPADVGRSHPETVLVHGPFDLTHGRLSATVRVPDNWPLPDGATEGHMPALVQLEALRQTALLAAGRMHQLATDRCTLGSLKVHFRGYAEPDMAMRCAAVVGLCGRDAEGRRLSPVTLTLTQGGRAVLEAVVTVVEDL
ncbi:AfsA-related hotdog domain-containing protein [Streptomyces sp. NPDC021056]|uniref:AfsA-related hotdog domain-containing protein n=1 Tax=Streptomyces sp. NPDC021056 TaxID=3155012 RepID=UPI0033C8800A